MGIRSKRHAIVEGNIARIPIGPNAKHGYAIVDKEYAHLDDYKWHLSAYKYAVTKIGDKHVRMHHFVMKPDAGKQIDHINLNPLDNRLSNLRQCSHAENMRNVKIRKNNSTGYKGVHIHQGKYRAGIRFNGKTHHLGLFATALEAAKAYDDKAIELHGEFARLNNG